jgi:hypothetical protein
MFDLLGVKYVMAGSTHVPSAPGSQYQLAFQGDGVSVYHNTQVVPRAFVVHDIQRVDDESAARAALVKGEPQFGDGAVNVVNRDLRHSAVVEADSAGAAPKVSSCDGSGDSARITEYANRSVTIDVNSACAGLLVLSDEYYPGWTATVNGKDANIYATDLALRGVPVPAGHSTVEFSYQPASLHDGVALAIIGGIAVVTLVTVDIVAIRRRKRRGQPGDTAQVEQTLNNETHADTVDARAP